MSTWAWSIEGTEEPSSPGSMVHELTDSGVVEAELMGEVVVWLAEHGPFWDLLDTDEAVTIRIAPAAQEDHHA